MTQHARRSQEEMDAVRLRLGGERTRPIVNYCSLLDAPLRSIIRWITSGNNGVFLDAIWEPEGGVWLTSYDAVKRFHSAVALAEILERTGNNDDETPLETKDVKEVASMTSDEILTLLETGDLHTLFLRISKAWVERYHPMMTASLIVALGPGRPSLRYPIIPSCDPSSSPQSIGVSPLEPSAA